MKVVFLIVAVGIFSVAAVGQTRIHFKPGATNAVVTGHLNGAKDKKEYVIRVNKGQVLTTDNGGKHHITVLVGPPTGSDYEDDSGADCHDHVEVNPTAQGDYKIYVIECLKAPAFRGQFKLVVTVR